MAVTFVALHCKGISQLLYHHRSHLPHASTGRESKRCKGAMCDFPYPISVLSLFVTLHLPKQRLEGLGLVALCVGVEYPGIKKCVTALGPKPSHPDVFSGQCWRLSAGGILLSEFATSARPQYRCVFPSCIMHGNQLDHYGACG